MEVHLHLDHVDRTRHKDVPIQDPPRRGITIWWPGEVVKLKRRKANRPVTTPMQTWNHRTIVFSAVRRDQGDYAPKDLEEMFAMVRLAYALVASHDPVPSDATILFEVVE